MSVLNGDAPVRYRISQGDQNWVVKLSAPDLDALKLRRWIADNEIRGMIEVVVEWRVSLPGEHTGWRGIEPMTIDTDDLR